MPYHGTLNLDVVHPLEVPRVLYRAAQVYRGAGQMLQETPGPCNLWDHLAEILERAGDEATKKLNEAGFTEAQG